MSLRDDKKFYTRRVGFYNEGAVYIRALTQKKRRR